MSVIGKDGRPLALTRRIPLPERKRAGKERDATPTPLPESYWVDDHGNRMPPNYSPFDHMTEQQLDAFADIVSPVLLPLLEKGRAARERQTPPVAPGPPSPPRAPPAKKPAVKNPAVKNPAVKNPAVKNPQPTGEIVDGEIAAGTVRPCPP